MEKGLDKTGRHRVKWRERYRYKSNRDVKE